MDALRGAALFGVFLMNLLPFANSGDMATDQQLLSLPTAPLDMALLKLLDCLFADKANTIFAFLFGLGFYIQMQRLDARGAESVRIYRRRLWVLFGFGVINTFFIWNWDILHLYALAGFALLAMRRLRNRDLLAIGLICGLGGRILYEAIAEFSGWAPMNSPNDEAAVLVRQQLSQAGDYLGIVANFAQWTVHDYLVSGLIFGWLVYALGRFLIGAWVGRNGWITRARDFLPRWRWLARWILPLGLALEGAATLLSESPLLPDWPHRHFLGLVVHLLAAPVLAAGYVSALVVAYHGKLGAKLLAPIAACGRMALTNYLAQGFVIGFVLFGVGPGLALAGKIGTTALFVIVVVTYAAQIAFSTWWLRRFAYGPVEWLWRALTYGKVPPMRLPRALGVATE